MQTKLAELEKMSQVLEPAPAERDEWTQQVFAYAQTFLEEMPDAPAFSPGSETEAAHLLAAPLDDAPLDMAGALTLLDQTVNRLGMNKLARGDMAFIPNGGLYLSALADYLAAVGNRYAGVTYGAPGAVRLERQVLAWLAEVIGYPATAAGDLTSGGSIANLSAVVTAREAAGLKAADIASAVVYLTGQTHHCVAKALRIAGLGEAVQRFIPLDEQYRMRPAALEAAIRADRQAGLRPWLVVASAGTTDTGAVDPLPAIAEVSRRQGLWLHVDGAYGGLFALCEPGRQALAGLALADSLVMDPHKGLFLPFGSGALLVREGAKLYQAFNHDASYLQDKEFLLAQAELSPADLSPELTRHFRGLRLWLPLKLLGVAPFRAALEEKLLLARYFHQRLSQIDGFEVGPAPDLSIVTYRYRPARGDANAFNRRLVQAVQSDGRIFISSTMLEGRFTLRLAILSFRTHLAQIETALAVLTEKAREIERG